MNSQESCARKLVERSFNRIKQRRHDELAAKYLAFIQLASIRPRAYETTH
jgi:transposase